MSYPDDLPTRSVGEGRVVITDVQIPFFRLMALIMKFVLASIPAYIILFILFAVVATVFGGIVAGLMGGLPLPGM